MRSDHERGGGCSRSLLHPAVRPQSRGAHFTGWYHSHPFDVGVHSNCFLSATDVSTQLSWQSMEDGAGNPFLAIVVDPLRSTAKGVPEIGAFRCYPPSYVPERGLAPDGVKWDDERARNARWGESCVRYDPGLLRLSLPLPLLVSPFSSDRV